MPDFNLMAEIDVQLASNAAKKLAASANKALKGVMADVKIEPIIKKNAYMERVFPGGNKLTRIKVGFEISETQKKILERALPKAVKVPVTIETKLDSKGLDFKALVEELKNTRLSFQVRNSEKTLSFLEDLNTKIKNLLSDDKNDRIRKLMRSIDLFSKVGVEKLSRLAGKVSGEEVQIKRNTQVRDLAKQARDAKKDVGALEKELLEIEAIAKRQKGQPDTFLNGLTRGLQDALNLAKQLSGAGRGSRIEADEKLATMFGGLSGNARSNATAAYTEIFKGLNEIYRIQQKMSSLTTDKNLLKQFTEQAQTAADKLKKLFVDPSVVSGGKNVTSVAVKNLVSDLRIMQTETENFRKGSQRILDEISVLKGSGDTGSDQVVKVLENRLSILQKLISEGKTYSQALESQQVKQTYSDQARLQGSARLLEQFKTTLQKTETGLDENDAFKTEAAQAVGLADKIRALIAEYQKFIDTQETLGERAQKTDIIGGREKFRALIDDLKNSTKTVQGFFDSLNNKMSYYTTDGLVAAASNTRVVKEQILRMIEAGLGISEISKKFNELNQQIEVNAKNEKGLRRFEDSLRRLQESFKYGLTSGVDEIGVGDYLENQIRKLRSAGIKLDPQTGFSTVADTDLRRETSQASYTAKSMQKINDTIERAREKLQRKIFESGGDSFRQVRTVYENALSSLNKYVSGINKTSGDINQLKSVHADLERQINATFQVASIKAMGGSVGEFTKAVGLAAKRLSAFLFAATPIYTLTSAIRQSAGEVVGLDKQFTKLTQILAGNGQSMKSAQEQSDQLAKSILNLGKAYGNSTVEIAESADVLAQAGIQGRDLAAILETVSKARLGPTFGSAEQISESIIATMNQFEIPARQMEGVIGGISQVAAQFPVEADGITKAIRRAGGAFAASTAQGQSYMDSLGDFVGAFTVLKGKTREADETLATSLRNVLTRLQRVSIQRFLKNRYQINLLDTQNQFVGFNEAIGKIVKRLDELGIASGDPRFAEIFEKISGPRQISRVLSLVRSFGEAKNATESFKSGAGSLDRDVGIAFGSIENKLGRAKAAVVDLFTELGRSPVFKSLVDGFTLVTQAITSTLSAVTGLIESLGVVGRLGAVAALGNLASSFLRKRLFQSGLDLAGVGNSFGNSFLGRRATPVVDVVGMNSGGLIPGVGPNIDTEPYLLTKGEYVLNRRSVSKYGKDFLNKLNSGKIKTANTGSGPGGFSNLPNGGGFGLIAKFSDIFEKLFSGVLGGISKKLSSLMSSKDMDAGSIFGPIVQNLSEETRDFIKANYDYGEDKRGGSKRGVHRRYREGRKGFLGVSRRLDSDSTDFTAKHEVGHAVDRKAGLKTKAGFASATQGEIFNKIAMAFISGDKGLKKQYAESVSKYDEAGSAKILKEVFANVFATSSDYQQRVLSSNTDQGAIDFIRSALADGGTKSDETNRILLKMLQELESDNKGLPQQQGFVKGRQGFRRPSGRIRDASQVVDSAGIKTTKFEMIGPQRGLIVPPPPKTGFKDLFKSTIKSSLTFNKLATAAGLSAISLGAFASSSKEASDDVRLLIEAVGGAVAVFTTASFAIAAAEKRIRGGEGSGILGTIFKKIGLSDVVKEKGGVGSSFIGQLKSIPDFLKRSIGPRTVMKAFNFVKGSGGLLSTAAGFGAKQYYSSKAQMVQEDLSKATSAEEVDALLAKRRGYESSSGMYGAIGGVFGGASAGALLGPKGAIIGGVIGGLTALGSSLKKTRIGKGIMNLFVKAGDNIGRLMSPILNALSKGFNEVTSLFGLLANSLTDPIAEFIEWLGGGKAESISKQEKFERDTALNEASIAKYVAAQNTAKPDAIGMSAQQYIAREGLGKALKRINDLVPNATEEQKSELKDQFTQLFNTVGGKTGGAEILKASGLSLRDVDRLNKELGASVSLVDQVRQLALEKSQQYFLRVTTLAEDLTNVITTAEQATNAFDKKIQASLGKITSSKLDESVFGQIETGRQVVGPAYQDFIKLMARFRKFNRQAFADVNERIALERGKADVSRVLSTLNEDNIKDAIRNTGGGSLDAQTFLIKELGKSLRLQGFGDEAVMKFQDVFETYLNQKSQELIEAAGETIKLSQLSEIVKGFDIDKGQIELLKAFEKSISDFEDGMKDKIKSRLEIESKINESLSKTLDTRKSLTEFLNKSIGGSKTGELTRSQAQQFELSQRAVQLRGTGLGAGASTRDIINRYRQVTRLESRSGVTPQTQFVKDALRSALESAAQGGEVMAKAMRDYESAAESAAKSAEKLSSALLGSDEEIINFSRGAEAFLRVQSGGLSSLMSLSSQEKSALKSYISGDESKTRVFEKSIGIKAKAGPTPESARVEEQFQRQLEAQNALTSINVDLSTNIGNLITEMVMNREAIIGFGVNMNKFAEATAQQAKNLSNMPTAVNHTLNVNPIVVSVNTQMDGIKSEQLKVEIANMAVQKVAEGLSRQFPDLTINPISPASPSAGNSANIRPLTMLH